MLLGHEYVKLCTAFGSYDRLRRLAGLTALQQIHVVFLMVC